MRKARLIETGEVDPESVDARKRLRAVTKAGVEAVVASYKELGVIKDPVDLRRKKGSQKPILLAGGHRLAAARALGIAVPYKLWDCTDDWAELCEIDDNLAGAELNPLDTAVFLSRRKRLYERLYPEAAQRTGADLVASRWNTADVASVVSFAAVTAEKFGLSERQVRRIVAAGEAIDDTEADALRLCGKPVTLADLQALAKIGDPDERRSVLWTFRNSSLPTIKKAIAFKKAEGAEPKTTVEDPVEEAFKDLLTRWRRAPKEARRRFVAAAFDEGLNDLHFDHCAALEEAE